MKPHEAHLHCEVPTVQEQTKEDSTYATCLQWRIGFSKGWIPGTISHQTDLSYENSHNEDRKMRFQAVPQPALRNGACKWGGKERVSAEVECDETPL